MSVETCNLSRLAVNLMNEAACHETLKNLRD